MKSILCLELHRAFKGRIFIILLSVLCLIMLYDIAFSVVPTSKDPFYQYHISLVTPHTLWVGLDLMKALNRTYLFLMPLLVVVPYGLSLALDRQSKYIISIITRVKKRDFLFAKFIAVFISGGTLYVVPLLLHFLVLCMVFPSWPHYYGDFIVPNENFYSLLYSNPTVYILFISFINFMYAGLFSTLAFVTSLFFRRVLVCFVFPFVFWIGFGVIAEALGRPYLSPERFLRPQGVEGMSLFYVLSLFIAILVVTIILCAKEGQNDEIN